ncbi:MAG TPA: regulatory protein RecX [Chthonomonadaceae bacterium]|nr:regulatory protein RecX [Chthonomonadaceae bacterium]
MNKEELEAARAVALRFMGYTARSRAEVERRLTRAEFPPEVVTAVLDELEERGWLDDAQLAQAWVADRADRKKYGRRRLAAELKRKGVDKETLQEAVGAIADADEMERALAAARMKWHPEVLETADSSALQAEKRRLAEFLQRRGFSWEIITQVLAQLMANKRE